MTQQTPPELSRETKLGMAYGAATGDAGVDLNLLIELAADPDPEVGKVGQECLVHARERCADGSAKPLGNEPGKETFAALDDAQCSRLLSHATLPESIARYFLEPGNVRPGLLASLLDHAACPKDAVAALALQAGPEIVGVLIEHLDLLRTDALVALKKNAAGRDSRIALPGISQPPLFRFHDKLAVAGGSDRLAEADRLAALVFLVSDSDAAVRDAALESLRQIPDDDVLVLLAEHPLHAAVARFFLDPKSLRPALLPLLLGHLSTPEDAVAKLAASADRETIALLLEQIDLLKTSALLALKDNQVYLEWQAVPTADGCVLEVDLLDMLIQEVEAASAEGAEEAKPFMDTIPELEPEKAEGVMSKIAKMTVAKRVILALRGNREERSILIRDGSKVVSRAVMGSPKLTDAEVEHFASLKNVSQDVLRLISMNRKYMKNYVVVRNLATNPRSPIDVSLNLLNRLLPLDLRALAGNRDVSDTVRKMADKLSKTRKQ